MTIDMNTFAPIFFSGISPLILIIIGIYIMLLSISRGGGSAAGRIFKCIIPFLGGGYVAIFGFFALRLLLK